MSWIMVTTLLLFALIGHAQEQFLAYQVSGSASYLQNNRQLPIKIGKVLDESREVRVGPKSTLTLICNSTSNTIQLKEGTYKLGQFNASCERQTKSLMANYFQFVWWQMTHPKASAAEEKKKFTTSSGAVTRGCPALLFYLPDTINYYKENIVLRWKLSGPVADRNFVFFQHENSPVPLFKSQPSRNFVMVDSLRSMLEPSKQYYWTIQVADKETCPKNLLQVWSKEDFTELFDQLKKQVPGGISEAEEYYLLGYLLEQHRFYGEAYSYYKQAASKNPSSNRYKKTLKRFREIFYTG